MPRVGLLWRREWEPRAGRVEGRADERLRLSESVAGCEPYLADDRLMVEQHFQERMVDGLTRVYRTRDRVVGFAHRYPAGLRPASAGEPPPGKAFDPSAAPAYTRLSAADGEAGLPELQQFLALETHELPVIWDADFLYGPKTDDGDDTYVLCEINRSSTFAFPDYAMPRVAEAAFERLAGPALGARSCGENWATGRGEGRKGGRPRYGRPCVSRSNCR